MGRRVDVYLAIQEHVEAHKRDGLDIDLTEAARRIATVIGPSGYLIDQIEELVAKAAEIAGVAAYVTSRGMAPSREK